MTDLNFISLEKHEFVQVRISVWNEEINHFDEVQVCHDFTNVPAAYNFIIKYDSSLNNPEDIAYPVLMERCDDGSQEYIQEFDCENDLLA